MAQPKLEQLKGLKGNQLAALVQIGKTAQRDKELEFEKIKRGFAEGDVSIAQKFTQAKTEGSKLDTRLKKASLVTHQFNMFDRLKPFLIGAFVFFLFLGPASSAILDIISSGNIWFVVVMR